MWTLIRDLRYGLRVLAKNPGFTAVAVITLAVGLGANTAIFSVVNTTFLRALPYPHPERLLWITERNSVSVRDGSVSYPNFLDWRAQQNAFSELSIYQIDHETLRTAHFVEQIPILAVSRGFFTALGVHVVPGLPRSLGFRMRRGRSISPRIRAWLAARFRWRGARSPSPVSFPRVSGSLSRPRRTCHWRRTPSVWA
jgi:hypothetical protein